MLRKEQKFTQPPFRPGVPVRSGYVGHDLPQVVEHAKPDRLASPCGLAGGLGASPER